MKDLEFYMFYGTYWEKFVAWLYYFNSLIKRVMVRLPPPYADDPFGPSFEGDDGVVDDITTGTDYFEEDEC